jgi:fumarate hydratase class I
MNDMTMAEFKEQVVRDLPALELVFPLTGTIVVARDVCSREDVEEFTRRQRSPTVCQGSYHLLRWTTQTREGYASGSFGPTTAGRMDAYVDEFMKNGGSYVTLAKGNGSKQVTNACKKYGGFYFG